jgi:hypothetical protein
MGDHVEETAIKHLLAIVEHSGPGVIAAADRVAAADALLRHVREQRLLVADVEWRDLRERVLLAVGAARDVDRKLTTEQDQCAGPEPALERSGED